MEYVSVCFVFESLTLFFGLMLKLQTESSRGPFAKKLPLIRIAYKNPVTVGTYMYVTYIYVTYVFMWQKAATSSFVFYDINN